MTITVYLISNIGYPRITYVKQSEKLSHHFTIKALRYRLMIIIDHLWLQIKVSLINFEHADKWEEKYLLLYLNNDANVSLTILDDQRDKVDNKNN